MIHVIHVEMPGRAPVIAGLFRDHMQACWTMVAIGAVLSPRAMWVAAEHTSSPPRRAADLWAEDNGVAA